MRSWYSIKNMAGGVIDVSLHDEIGLWGVSAAEFIAELNDHKGATAINLSIHSPGGSVLDGFAMYNALKLQDSIVNIYVKRTNLEEAEVRDMMNDETWLNAADSVGKGFADTITKSLGVAAKMTTFNKHFKSMPVENNHDIEKIETIKDFERHLRDVCGLSKGLALALTSRAKALFRSDSDPAPNSTDEILAALERFRLPK